MSSRLNRVGYTRLITEDIAWLMEQPRTLERDHIKMVLDKAVEYEYGPTPDVPKYGCTGCTVHWVAPYCPVHGG